MRIAPDGLLRGIAIGIVLVLTTGCGTGSVLPTAAPQSMPAVHPVAPSAPPSAAAPASSAAPASVAAPASTPPAPTPASTTATPSTAPGLTITTAQNFRDVAGTGAGLPLKGGGHMVRGLVFRSAALAGLSASDKAKLVKAGISDIYDLRTPSVARGTPDPKIGDAKNQLINLFGGSKVPPTTGSTKAARVASKVAMNRNFVTDPAQRARLGVFLTSFATAKGPVIIHCTEGKDRTGFVSMVLQSLAGVDKKTIVAEYLKSNDARKQFINDMVNVTQAAYGKAAADLKRVDLTVYPEQIQASMDAIASKYGSIDKFLTKGVGLSKSTVATIRERLRAQ